ncbi:MAG TPA: hypothetical protein VLT36_14435 [Candidatus Dormibacteraeota bacterium]|nr:hypothetical protein [Candidatus Dormibacteraeota bacterium]
MKTTTFLLVDGDSSTVSAAGRGFLMAPPGTKFKVVENGVEAYQYLRGAGPYSDREAYPIPDFVLVRVGSGQGLDFLGWLREKAPEACRQIPVIILSSCGLSEELERARKLAVSLFLLEPIDWAKFWAHLERADSHAQASTQRARIMDPVGNLSRVP